MKKRLLIISSMVALAMVASVAWAYWTTEGTGTGSATVDGQFPLGLDIDSEVLDTEGDGLHPGDDLDLEVTVTNPATNEGTAYFAGVTATTINVVDAACDDTDFTIADVTDFDDHTVEAGDTATATATLVYADDTANSQDDCKSDTVNIVWDVDNTLDDEEEE